MISPEFANKRTTANYQMDLNQQKGTLRAYYASVSFVDELVGKTFRAEATGQRDNTIVIFTSDHGYHLANMTFGRRSAFMKSRQKYP